MATIPFSLASGQDLAVGAWKIGSPTHFSPLSVPSAPRTRSSVSFPGRVSLLRTVPH